MTEDRSNHVIQSTTNAKPAGSISSDIQSGSNNIRRQSDEPKPTTGVRQYASINVLPPPQVKSRTHTNAPLGSIISASPARASIEGASESAALTNNSSGSRSFEAASRSSIASHHNMESANQPFTYSGVFASQGIWDSAADDSGHEDAASSDKWRSSHDIIHAASSPLALGSSSGDRALEKVHESEDSDESDDCDESDLESYEGLAVEDIHEAYDQNLPEYVPNSDAYRQTIHLEEEDITIQLRGMGHRPIALLMYRVSAIVTCGLVALVCRWVPRWRIAWTMRAEPLAEAEFIVATDEFGTTTIERIQRQFYGGTLESIFGALTRKGPLQDRSSDVVNTLAMFSYRYYRFVFHPHLGKFLANVSWTDTEWTRNPMSVRDGLTYDVRVLRRTIFGSNSIDIEEKSWARLLVEEVLNPFYIFQAGSVILWCFDNYYYYASCILLISISGIAEALIETRRNTRKIKEMAHFTCAVRVVRDGAWRDGNSNDLMPGDVFEVDAQMNIVPCDAVLLEGDCIVNESMLTGESVPVAKTPALAQTLSKLRLASSTFGSDIAKHVLFSGTKVVRAKHTHAGFGAARWGSAPSRVTAMVLRTGFNTTKGSLVRSILFPRPNKFKFYADSLRFIGVLAAIAVLGFIASIGNFLRLGLNAHIIIVRALDLITVVVPPALPATMSIGVSFALARLRSRRIYCISPTRINVCGKVNVMCFDKTGTLTEEGLDVLGVRAVDCAGAFTDLIEDPSKLPIGPSSAPSAPSSAFSSADAVDLPRKTVDPSKLNMLHALTTCHAVKLVDGELVGDPLDVKMFESTGWTLEENDGSSLQPSAPLPTVVRPPQSAYEIGIIRTFDFSASLRRQSVIAKRLGSKYNEVYVKGAPEAIRELCFADTIPRGFDAALLDYTNHGYRVLAVAGKPLRMAWPKIQRLKRDTVERDLVFMGLVVFENKLKPTTAPVLSELHAARIRQIMCTGDNVLTAISVARECGMIPDDMHVFVPRVIRDADVPHATVVWEDAADELQILDPYTLEPRLAAVPAAQYLATDRRQYYNWLHNLTDHDHKLSVSGNYCLAVTGEAFRFIMDEAAAVTLERMLMRGAVYARMSPDEKAELVEELQKLGYCAGFCGDGANDCGALRAADVGLSLSEAEASVAAPFTSHSTDIQCVLEVIREGRAALVTSFSCFKYMALYSIIQFTSVSLLYEFGGGLGDFQFLYIDLFIIVPLAVFMGRTPAHSRIAPKRPTANLISKRVLTSLFGQITINSLIQYLIYSLVKRLPEYTPPVRSDPNDLDSLLITSFENTVLFLISSFQYIIVACVFSIGPPYRQSNLRNYGLVITCTILVAFTIFVTVWPTQWTIRVFELVDVLGIGFRWVIVTYAALNFMLCFVGENWGFPYIAPILARSTRVLRYLVFRTVRGTEYAEINGEASADGGEEGHRPLTWSEIAQKKEVKPYKRILREMGIPVWY